MMVSAYKRYVMLSATWFLVWYGIAAFSYGHVSNISTLGIYAVSVAQYAVAFFGSAGILWLASNILAAQKRLVPLSRLVRALTIFSVLVVFAPYSVNWYFFWVHVGLALCAAASGLAISVTVARLTRDLRIYALFALQLFGLFMVFYTWPMGPADILWRFQFAYELFGILPVYAVLCLTARLIKEP